MMANTALQQLGSLVEKLIYERKDVSFKQFFMNLDMLWDFITNMKGLTDWIPTVLCPILPGGPGIGSIGARKI